MDHTILIILAAVVAVLLLAVLLLRNRRQHVTFGDAAAVLPTAERRATSPAPAAAASAPPPPAEGQDVSSEIAAAIEDVVDQFVGLDAHPSGAAPISAGDTLTTLKGLGPKAASLLQSLGVTRFDQIASWTEADVAAIDAQMGAFKGRIQRDRWVDQARLLAAGDRAGFEEQFGKLGG